MKRLFSVAAIALTFATAQANQVIQIINGNYDPKTLNQQQCDSILNNNLNKRYKLEFENKTQLYRHSFTAECYLVDTQKNTRVKLAEEPIRDPKISQNGKYVVYAKNDNNLYIYKVDFGTEISITNDGAENIFNGISDWLYEEEFGTTSLFDISPDNKLVAFVKLNETDVPTFEWQNMLPSMQDSIVTEIEYPTLQALRYPRAGQANAKAKVCIYDIHNKGIREIQLPDWKEAYIPRLKWGVLPAATKANPQPTPELILMMMNRDQNKMTVLKANPKSTVSHPFYEEESKKYYLDFMLFDQWQWLSDGRVIVVSEKDGYVQAYLYTSDGMEQKALTPDHMDLTAVYGVDEKTQTLYYQAAPTPITRQAYACNLRKGTITQITQGQGTHALTFSNDMSQYIDCYQSNTTPNRYTLHNKNGVKLLLDNDSIALAWKHSGFQDKEFFTITTERGDTLHAWRILPANFDPSQRYPVVMMQYSGPGSQRVTDTWRKRFGHYLSAQGYIVVCADPRGTAARGRAWRNATYMQLGVKEAEDQMSVARHLRTLPYVDAQRIALCGWSYGGYQTLMCMSMQEEQLWKCGMAIAPVTSWRLYDSAYTERYMRRPQVNEAGYDKADVMHLAANRTGELLIVHGLADDNVHAQHTWGYVDALVQDGKQFEMQIYPDDNHFIRRGENYQHLHNRLLIFLENNL